MNNKYYSFDIDPSVLRSAFVKKDTGGTSVEISTSWPSWVLKVLLTSGADHEHKLSNSLTSRDRFLFLRAWLLWLGVLWGTFRMELEWPNGWLYLSRAYCNCVSISVFKPNLTYALFLLTFPGLVSSWIIIHSSTYHSELYQYASILILHDLVTLACSPVYCNPHPYLIVGRTQHLEQPLGKRGWWITTEWTITIRYTCIIHRITIQPSSPNQDSLIHG
jgi:hypothetical protein